MSQDTNGRPESSDRPSIGYGHNDTPPLFGDEARCLESSDPLARFTVDGFDRVAPNVRDSDGEHVRAAAAEHDGRPIQRQRVLDALVDAGVAGLTDEQTARELGEPRDTTSRRRGDLRDMGYVVDTGRRRKTSRNRDAIVWRALNPTEPGYGVTIRKRRQSTKPADGAKVVALHAQVIAEAGGPTADVRCTDGRCVCDICNRSDCRHITLVRAA